MFFFHYVQLRQGPKLATKAEIGLFCIWGLVWSENCKYGLIFFFVKQGEVVKSENDITGEVVKSENDIIGEVVMI